MGLLETLSKVGQFLPGSELAKGLGISTVLPSVSKAQEATTQRKIELDNAILKQLKLAKQTGDTAKWEKFKKLALENKGANLIDVALEDAPTTKQVLASGGELALTAALGYKPSPVKQLAKATATAKKLETAGKLTKFGVKVVKPIAREAAIGSVFGGLTEVARNKEANINSIVKSAESGALIGGAFTGGAMALGAGLKAGARVATPPLKRFSTDVLQKLETTAKGLKTPGVGNTQLERTLSYIGEPTGIKAKLAQKVLGGIEKTKQLKSGLIDRFSPLQRIENELFNLKGTTVKEKERIYREARLLQSVADNKAETLVKKLSNDLKPFQDIEDKYTAYLTQLDFIDRARLGQKVPGGQSLDDLEKGLINLTREFGEDMPRVGEVRNVVRNYHTNLLQQRVDAGLLSSEEMNRLLQTHPNYIPHNVMVDIEERAVNALGNSLNVAKTDIMKAVGSVRNIENPIVATIQRTPIATRLIQKNKLLNNIVSVAEENTGLLPGLKLLKSGVKPESGYGTINLFKNGESLRYQVPKDLEIAIKNLDGVVTPEWFKWVTTPQRILKKFATQYNLSFALPNKFRDKQTAALTANAFIEEMAKKTGATAKELNLTANEIKDLYKASGGYGSSIFKEGEDKIFMQLRKSGLAQKFETVTNPAKAIEAINESLEQSTRLSVFKQGLERGLSPQDAALVSRDATIDFAKMGEWMKPLNQAIPFLNARVQGFINLPKAFINSPETFARMQLYTAAYPAMLLHQHNRRFESYENVSQYFKDKYWVIMTGETPAVDSYTGQQIMVPQFITIPKGEGQSLVANPIQYFLEKSDGRDFRKTSEMIADTVGSASPLEFQSFNGGNRWLSMISQLGPLGTVPTGLATNIDPFTGRNIIPERAVGAKPEVQYKQTTPEITKKVAGILNVSPAKLEFILDSFGGVTQDIQNAIDVVTNVVREGKIGGNSISETPFGSATQVPLTRRFLRESTPYVSPEAEMRREQKETISREVTTEKLKETLKAEDIYREMVKKQSYDERLNYLNSLGDELTPELKKKISAIKKSRQTVEALSTSDSVEVRARYITERITEMISEGIAKEDRVKFLEDLTESKILTDAVRKRMAEIKSGQ